jgi:hypothetical protein
MRGHSSGALIIGDVRFYQQVAPMELFSSNSFFSKNSLLIRKFVSYFQMK